MTLRQYINDSIARLAPMYTPSEGRWLMRIILEHLRGWSQTDILMKSDSEIDTTLSELIEPIIGRLLKHEPIQYILGETYWHGLNLKVTPAVLIPREETSELIDIITDNNKGNDLNVLDICTGSGCIAIALARTLPFANVTAIDISPNALDVARQNAASCKVNVKYIQCDALKPLPLPSDSFDIIVSNPPYIAQSEDKLMSPNVLEYEPHSALFVPDDDPLRFYSAISADAMRLLKSGGRLYYEINPIYSSRLAGMLERDGWTDVTVIKDIHGKNRFISALHP